MRSHPIGTGSFKFVDYKLSQWLKVERNPDYWKPGRPYLDGIEYTIVPNRSTAVLGFIAGKFDIAFPWAVTIPLLKDIRSQAPQAICDTEPLNVDILGEGQGDISAVMLPPPEGIWGMPIERLRSLPGYDPDVTKNRDEAREIMRKNSYGPDTPLKLKVSVRNIPAYRDPAAILIDQLRRPIGIDGELETIETANWIPKMIRKDYIIAISLSGSAVDDPNQIFYESYVCKSPRNYTGYCSPEVEALIDRQSVEPNPEKRKQIVWQIERRMIEDTVRPVIYHMRAATCWHPQVKNLTQMVNSAYDSWRMEDLWLDR